MDRCRECGGTFTRKKYAFRQIYCSRRCNDIVKIRKLNKGIVGSTINCVICNKEFTKKCATGKYCSIKCQRKKRYLKLKTKRLKEGVEPIGITKKCEHCGKEFKKKCSTGKYCSEKCRGKKRSEFLQERIDTIPKYKIIRALRASTHRAFKYQKQKKNVSATKLLGISPEGLRKHLKRQFYGNMTLENLGKVWHIDHIIPLSSFDVTVESEVKKACHYTNLQPLLIKHNLQKSASLNWDKEKALEGYGSSPKYWKGCVYHSQKEAERN